MMMVFVWSLLLSAVMFLSRPGVDASSPASDKDAQIQKAIQMCRGKLSQDPDFPKALHMLGMLLESSSSSLDDPFSDSWSPQVEEIAISFWKAGMGESNALEDSTRIDSLIRGATHFLKLGDTVQASACYHKALDLTIQLNQESGVLESILHEATPTLLSSLPSTLSLEKDTLPLVQRLLERFPSHPLVHQLHGAVLRKSRRAYEAHQAYNTATSLLQQQLQNGSNPIQWIQSCILAAASALEAGLPEAAQMAYLIAAEQSLHTQLDIPSNIRSDLYNNMGIVQKKAGNTKEAIMYFQKAVSWNPGDGHALAQLASLNVDVSSTTYFDPDYVQGLFDGYAARFENELVEDLNYKGHQMVVDALKKWWEENDASCLVRLVKVIDIGSGTGLVGEEIKKIHSNIHLQGFDLSQRMVDFARARRLGGKRVYNRVEQGDAVELLAQESVESIDAIIAADVFIYIGDVSSILEAARSCLKGGSVIVFSLETIPNGMQLLPSGRFGHSKEYIRERARLSGLELVRWSDVVIRKQRGGDVQGAIVIVQKPMDSHQLESGGEIVQQ